MKRTETSTQKRAQNCKKVNFKKYLENGTGKILEIVSSPDVDVSEKLAIIDAYADELRSNIGTVDSLRDCEPILNGISIKFVDADITAELSKDSVKVEGCNRGIKLCQRQRKLFNLFQTQQWSRPEIENKDIDRCENIFLNRKEGLSIAEKIQNENDQLKKLLVKAQDELSTELCDDALKLLMQMESDKSAYESKGFALKGIYAKDNGDIRKKIESIRSESEEKNALHKKLYDTDSSIENLILQSGLTEAQWVDIISLAQKQSKLISECNRNVWPLPTLKYTDPENLSEQYTHYLDMIKTDRAIVSQMDSLSVKSPKAFDGQFESFYTTCQKQGVNITYCKKKSWAVPELLVDDPLALSEKTRSEREKAKKSKKMRLFSFVAVISILSAVILLFIYKQGKILTPFDSSSVIGEKSETICNELEKAGFTNVTTKEDKDGWLNDGVVTHISLDGSDSFAQGKYVKPDADIVVYFSSKGRKEISGLLKQWANTDFKTLGEQLKSAGFENISQTEEDTFDKTKNQQIASVTVNGLDYSSGECYVPTSAPINITHYLLKIRMETSASKFEGKNYEDVISSLRASGFVNIEPRRADNLKIGLFKKEGDISSFSIGGDYSFDKGTIFNYYDPIVIVVNTYPGSGCDDITVIA